MSTTSAIEYKAPWPVYALAWSNAPIPSTSASAAAAAAASASANSRYDVSPNPQRRASLRTAGARREAALAGVPLGARLAIGSFVEEYTNELRVLGIDRSGAVPCFRLLASAPHPYPATKIMFQPSTLSATDDASPSPVSPAGSRGYMSASSKSAKRASWGGGVGGGRGGYDDGSGEWEIENLCPDKELLATTADCLRVWECYREDESLGTGQRASYVGARPDDAPLKYGLREKSVLAHSKNTSSPPAPLTSFSWNTPSPNLIVTSSIDTTCTIWDLPSRTALTQLIAHDREVYDVDWCPGSADVFASVGADGSVRVFDLRSLEHSTIIYETGAPGGPGSGSRPGSSASRSGSGGPPAIPAAPLLRIAFNPWDANYLATFHLDSESVQILDVRAPGSPILELRGHAAAVNAVAWGPPGSGLGGMGPSKGMVCTGGDDSQCLVYDLASSTLRSASAQGRRSRNGAGPSPAPSSAYSATNSPAPGGMGSSAASTDGGASIRGIGAETPILAYSAGEMVNNIAWYRVTAAGERDSGSGTAMGGPGGQAKSAVVQEWDEYAAASGLGGGGKPVEYDWLALASGSSVKAMRV